MIFCQSQSEDADKQINWKPNAVSY